ncbi:hypothetical protein PDIG_23530 [Penicillium digitatum PHI26]|uniref:Uncharacterized protein n=2 Tax=Penicillium digitatum TaxID=36651 RepID=K9GMR1_PEND2|nr:hypothetical protein PDIP_15940 [Penicillium digitatum Pd1]EKV15998.1 hypothetical protein PDIG_23530 [Penicillium digitatum PHI26]EKV20510.1 hypothetical protein PDIP_15940 [Penicillium digitatum Pd1]
MKLFKVAQPHSWLGSSGGIWFGSFFKTGSVLIFQQRNLFHGGDDVVRGVKHTLRTEVMYTTE